jgi:hypothetical protein
MAKILLAEDDVELNALIRTYFALREASGRTIPKWNRSTDKLEQEGVKKRQELQSRLHVELWITFILNVFFATSLTISFNRTILNRVQKMVDNARRIYARSDRHYHKIAEQVGQLKPGERKIVPPGDIETAPTASSA